MHDGNISFKCRRTKNKIISAKKIGDLYTGLEQIYSGIQSID